MPSKNKKNKKQVSKKRRRQARGSLKNDKPKEKNPFEILAETDAYVLKGKLKKITKDERGRPTVMIPEVVRKLELAFAYDATVEEACSYAGISRETYYQFIKINTDFPDRVDELREGSFMLVRRKLGEGAVDSFDNALKYSERKRKQEFSLRTEVAHSGEIVNRHAIDPETEKAIKAAFGNFARKVSSIKKKDDSDRTTGKD